MVEKLKFIFKKVYDDRNRFRFWAKTFDLLIYMSYFLEKKRKIKC